MQIIAGKFKGLKLHSPQGKGRNSIVRPTSSRVRTNIFNLLTNSHLGNRVENARVLDLFAGTGVMGLEALSRGASFTTFVENNSTSINLVKRNIAKTNRGAQTSVMNVDATRLPTNSGLPYELVLMDPPYGKNLVMDTLKSIHEGRWTTLRSIVVIESDGPLMPSEEFVISETRRYGSTHVTICTFQQGRTP